MAMGARLAELGIAAMVPDNIGQGDRNRSEEFKSPSHWNSVAPFYCGLTLQGMIVMETVALIRYMAKDPRFDSARFAACGNSGGGDFRSGIHGTQYTGHKQPSGTDNPHGAVSFRTQCLRCDDRS